LASGLLTLLVGSWRADGFATLLLAAERCDRCNLSSLSPEATWHSDAVVTDPRPAPHLLDPADEIATGGDFKQPVEHSAAYSASVTQRYGSR
jgi:hypothetical protein